MPLLLELFCPSLPELIPSCDSSSQPYSQQQQAEAEGGHQEGGTEEAGDEGANASADGEGGCEAWGEGGVPRSSAKERIVVAEPAGAGNDDDDYAPVRTPGSSRKVRKVSVEVELPSPRFVEETRKIRSEEAVEKQRRQPRTPIEFPASDAEDSLQEEWVCRCLSGLTSSVPSVASWASKGSN